MCFYKKCMEFVDKYKYWGIALKESCKKRAHKWAKSALKLRRTLKCSVERKHIAFVFMKNKRQWDFRNL